MIHTRYGGSGLGLFICRSECGPRWPWPSGIANAHQRSPSCLVVESRSRASSDKVVVSDFASRSIDLLTD
jgi:hypothetical protein